MKSFCVKNNNKIVLDYLLTEIKNSHMENVVAKHSKFKNFNNIIVHYTGQNDSAFVYKLSEILTKCIIKYYEDKVVSRVINLDYFYFDSKEKNIIYNNCIELLCDNTEENYNIRKEKIFECLVEYIFEHKYFILDGFVNFRLFEYNSMVEDYVDTAVDKFIIDREYKEFIELLRSYIKSQKNRTDIIHIIYSNSEPILMDENQNILLYENQFNHPKYLSDITFSSKDYCLNELLTLLPKKIIIHLLVEEDEFIETLKLIFENRLFICKECNICKTFSLLNIHG